MTSRGRSIDPDELKPGEGDRDPDVEISISWRSSGFVVDAYWPGRRRIVVDSSDDVRVTPRVVLEEPCRHCPATQTTDEEEDATTDAT